MVVLQTMAVSVCIPKWKSKKLNTERMEERNYINYIYRVKRLCLCKKTDFFFYKKIRN